MKRLLFVIDCLTIATTLWLFFQVMGVMHQVDRGLISESPSLAREKVSK